MSNVVNIKTRAKPKPGVKEVQLIFEAILDHNLDDDDPENIPKSYRLVALERHEDTGALSVWDIFEADDLETVIQMAKIFTYTDVNKISKVKFKKPIKMADVFTENRAARRSLRLMANSLTEVEPRTYRDAITTLSDNGAFQ